MAETIQEKRDRMYKESRAQKTSNSIPNAMTHKIPNQIGKDIPNQVPMEGMGGYGGAGDRKRKAYIDENT